MLILKKHKFHHRWTDRIELSQLVKQDLQWWQNDTVGYNEMAIRPAEPSLTVTSDASLGR